LIVQGRLQDVITDIPSHEDYTLWRGFRSGYVPWQEPDKCGR
jgi:hypothetical protein